MFFRSLSAERIKLTTTASLYWNTIIFFVVTVGMAVLMGFSVKQSKQGGVDPNYVIPETPEIALSGIQLGLIIIVIMATMVVTTEYSAKLSQVTFAATPARITVALAKLLLCAIWAAAVTFIGCVVSLYLFNLFSGATIHPFTDSDARFTLGAEVLSAVLYVWFAMAIAWIVRRTAGAISLSIIWITVAENLVGLIPRWGEKIQHFLPFSNLSAFVKREDLTHAPWGWEAGAAYFALVVFVIFAVGMVLLQRRDA